MSKRHSTNTASNELTERQRYWLSHVEQVESQGMPLSEYAKQHGLSIHSLYSTRSWWRQRNRQTNETTPMFKHLRVTSENHTTGGLRIALRNGIDLHLPPLDNTSLCRVIAELNRL